MDGGGAASDASEIDWVDVSNVPLGKLLSSDDTVLTNALRRLLAHMDGPPENFAAFDSTP